MTERREQPDWPPASSAMHYPEGTRMCGSTGQAWQVRDRRWVRLTEPKIVARDGECASNNKED